MVDFPPAVFSQALPPGCPCAPSNPQAILEQASANPGCCCLTFTALASVVISLYYYFGVVRAVYWSADVPDLSPIRVALYACILGMLCLGLVPGSVVNVATQAAKALH